MRRSIAFRKKEVLLTETTTTTKKRKRRRRQRDISLFSSRNAKMEPRAAPKMKATSIVTLLITFLIAMGCSAAEVNFGAADDTEREQQEEYKLRHKRHKRQPAAADESDEYESNESNESDDESDAHAGPAEEKKRWQWQWQWQFHESLPTPTLPEALPKAPNEESKFQQPVASRHASIEFPIRLASGLFPVPVPVPAPESAPTPTPTPTPTPPPPPPPPQSESVRQSVRPSGPGLFPGLFPPPPPPPPESESESESVRPSGLFPGLFPAPAPPPPPDCKAHSARGAERRSSWITAGIFSFTVLLVSAVAVISWNLQKRTKACYKKASFSKKLK